MDTLTAVFSEDQIQKRVREMALEVSRDCGEEVLQVVGILENSFVFMADMVRMLTCPVVCHFIRVKIKDTTVDAQALQSIVYSTIDDIEAKSLLVMDALVATGVTHDYLVQQLLGKKPKSLRTAALIDRAGSRRVPLRLDYVGFSWDGGPLVGYGLAKDGLYRNLPYVATVTTAAEGA